MPRSAHILGAHPPRLLTVRASACVLTSGAAVLGLWLRPVQGGAAPAPASSQHRGRPGVPALLAQWGRGGKLIATGCWRYT